jgi:hypothetical protein
VSTLSGSDIALVLTAAGTFVTAVAAATASFVVTVRQSRTVKQIKGLVNGTHTADQRHIENLTQSLIDLNAPVPKREHRPDAP